MKTGSNDACRKLRLGMLHCKRRQFRTITHFTKCTYDFSLEFCRHPERLAKAFASLYSTQMEVAYFFLEGQKFTNQSATCALHTADYFSTFSPFLS